MLTLFNVLTKAGLTLCDFVEFFYFFILSPLGSYLSDCTNIIMSHYGISVGINVRLYIVKTSWKRVRARTCLQFYIIYPYKHSDCELHSTRNPNVGYHEKYMNGDNTDLFKKNSVCSSTHPHENNATSIYIEKAIYQMNSISGVRERRRLIEYGW